jgi:preprotein translocase subunit SecY
MIQCIGCTGSEGKFSRLKRIAIIGGGANLKRGGSFIPGVRPGKQTKDFLDGVISRITVVGAGFIAVVALIQYIAPAIARIPSGTYISLIGGTSLLIVVQVALETMRQIEAHLLMKQYG